MKNIKKIFATKVSEQFDIPTISQSIFLSGLKSTGVLYSWNYFDFPEESDVVNYADYPTL